MKRFLIPLAFFLFLLSFASQTQAVCTAVATCGNITVAGCYVFTANVTFATAQGTCSHVLISDVRIDGAGFWLTGTGVNNNGIVIQNNTATANDNITITNLVMNNFTNAIQANRRLNNVFIDGNTFYRNLRAIQFDNVNSSLITNNFISNVLGTTPKAQNDGNGIQVGSNSISVNITKNRILNTSNGIVVSQRSGGTSQSATATVRDNTGLNFHQTSFGLGVGLGCDGCWFNNFVNNSMNNSGFFTAGEGSIENLNNAPRFNNWTDNNFNKFFNLNTTASAGAFLINASTSSVVWRNTFNVTLSGTNTFITQNASNLNLTFNRFSGRVVLGADLIPGVVLSSAVIDRNLFAGVSTALPQVILARTNNTIFRNNVVNYSSQNTPAVQGVFQPAGVNNTLIYNNSFVGIEVLDATQFRSLNVSFSNNTITLSDPIILSGNEPNVNFTFNNTVFANGTATVTLGNNGAGNANVSGVFINNSRRDTIYNNATSGNGSIYQYWTRNWYVNQSGAPAVGANITFRNDNNLQVFSCVSDGNGWCNQTLHLQFFRNGTLSDNQTVWNLTVSKSGDINNTNVTIDFSGDYVLNLPFAPNPFYIKEVNPADFTYFDNYTQPLNWTITWNGNGSTLDQVNFWFNGDNTTFIPINLGGGNYRVSIFGLGAGSYTTFWNATTIGGGMNSTNPVVLTIAVNRSRALVFGNGTFIPDGGSFETLTATSNFSEFNFTFPSVEGFVRFYFNQTLLFDPLPATWNYTNTTPIKGYYELTFEYWGSPSGENTGNFSSLNYTVFWLVDQGIVPPPNASVG